MRNSLVAIARPARRALVPRGRLQYIHRADSGYGSDGFNVPEINFVSAQLGKQTVAQALDEIVADGGLSAAEAREAAGWILSGTARRLYRLD